MKHKNNLYRLSPVTLTLLLMVFALQMGFGQKILLQENFDYTDDTAAQTNWTYGTEATPIISDVQTSDSGTKSIILQNNNSSRTGSISKSLNLTAGVTYSISAKYLKGTGGKAGNLRLVVSDGTDSTDNQDSGSASTSWQIFSYDFTPLNTSTYTLNALESSKVSSKNIYVDEILITYPDTENPINLENPISECNLSTLATDETYKVTIPFTNGGNFEHTISANFTGGSTTNTGDDPNTASSGNLIFNGIPESSDLTLTITDSGSNSISIPSITKPDCGPNTFTGGTNGTGVGYKKDEFWSKGHVPSNIEEAIIQVNCNLTNNLSFEVYKLTVNSEAILNFTKQNELLVGAGGIVNNGTITFTQDAANSAVLKVTSTVSGSGVYEYEVFVQAVTDANNKKVSLIAPPVTGETITDVLANDIDGNILKQSDLGTGDQILFGPYNPSIDTFSNFTTASTDNLNNGQGYRAALYQTVGTITFKGGIEVANKTVSGLTAEKFNLVGNPYTTGYSLKGFVTDNSSNLDDLNTAVTYWNASTGGYSTKSQSELNITDVYLAPAQAFFVKLAATKTSVAFNKGDSQIYQSSPIAPFRSNNEDLSGIGLHISHTDAIKTTKLYFNDSATLGVDRGHEAQAFGKAIADFGIYTQLANDSRTEPLAVQTIPATGLENTTLKLGVNAGLGEHTLSLEGINLPDNLSVYLTDLANGSETMLNKYDYTFNVTDAPIEGADRFLISFQSDALSTGDNALEQLQIAAFKNTITVNGDLKNNTTLKVYDLQGRKVAQTALSINNRQLTVNNSAGVYVVNLSNAQGSKTQKVILK